MIMCVSAGGGGAQHLALCDFTHKHHMAAQILLLDDLAGEHCIGVLRQVEKTIVAPLCLCPGIQLVDLAAGLHTEVADGLEGNILRQHADIEYAGPLNHLFGQILALAGDGDAGGIIGNLNTGVDDAAVVFVILRGQNEQAVAEIAKGFGIMRRFILLSESSAPADPSEPCHDEPRRGPFRGRCRG